MRKCFVELMRGAFKSCSRVELDEAKRLLKTATEGTVSNRVAEGERHISIQKVEGCRVRACQ